MKKVILMSLQNVWIGNSPARYQLLEKLEDRGFETYVFVNGHLKQKEKFPFVHHVVNISGMRNKDIRKKIKDISPQVVIASTREDVNGIFLLPWNMKKTAFYYYNLEIYTSYVSAEIKRNNRGIYWLEKMAYPYNKMKEIVFTKKIKAFTIQDSIRKEVSKKFYICHNKTILIPNSYVFDKDKIDGSVGKGVAFTGGIARWGLSDQLYKLEFVKKTPVTFAGRIDSYYWKQIAKLKQTNPNLAFIEQQLLPEQYTDYIRQFAVGFVWYDPPKDDANNCYMGLASGKMFKYLSLGKPIIAMNCFGLSHEIRKYNLGVVIDDISQLDDAYTKIMEKYAFYQENVIRVYKNRYDFNKTIKPFLDCMEKDIEGLH